MTGARQDTGRVEKAIAGLGARIRRVPGSDEVDFRFDGIDGFARERRGKCRVSFVIALDPSAEVASEFVAAHGDVPGGEVQYGQDDGGDFIRLLTELPFDDAAGLYVAAQTARALRAAWIGQRTAGADLVSTLGAAGLAVPPLGSTGLSDVHVYGGWSWGSGYIPPFVLYMFEVELVARRLMEHGPTFALAHAGRGVNSYGLNLVTSAGPVAAYVQHGYGGGYGDPVQDLVAINASYSRLHVLLRAAAELPADEVRWLLVYSQFRGICGLVDLEKVRAGGDFGHGWIEFGTESSLFEAVVERLELSDADLGTAGSVSW